VADEKFLKDSKELFTEHLEKFVFEESKWKYIDENEKSKGIYITTKWRDGIQRVTRIIFNGTYPDSPPILKVTPRPKDKCFDSEGFLHWAENRQKRVWDKYKNHMNPLIYLVDELYDKYGIDVYFDLKT